MNESSPSKPSVLMAASNAITPVSTPPNSNGGDRRASTGYELAVSHYTSLKQYLNEHLQKINGVSSQRQSARDKLTRLTKQQFQELSTDVFDETNRRIMNSNEVPFLPVCDDYHPKRNQARQKLATLPESRFKDLASDVFAELERRYPVLSNIPYSPPSAKDNHPLPLEPADDPSEEAAAPVPSTSIQPVIAPAAQVAPVIPPAVAPAANPPANNPPQPVSQPFVPSAAAAALAAVLASQPPPVTPHIAIANKPVLNKPPAPASVPISSAATATSDPNLIGSNQNIDNNNVKNFVAPPVDLQPPPISVATKPKPVPTTSNFANLDSLMADLGNLMVADPPADQRKTSHASSLDIVDKVLQESEIIRIRKEYEATIATKDARIAQLEAELKDHSSKQPAHLSIIQSLEEKLEQNRLTLTNLRLEKDSADKINRDQLNTINQLQVALQEKSQLLDSQSVQHANELRALKEQLEQAEKQRELEKKRVKTLLEEKNKLELDLNEAQMENITLKQENKTLAENAAKAGAASKQPHPNSNNTAAAAAASSDGAYPISLNGYEGQPDETDGIDPSRISTFKLAAEKLLQSITRESPSQVLIAIRSLVVASRNILEDSESFDIRFGKAMAATDRERLANVQGKINLELQDLMSAAKRHATSQGNEFELRESGRRMEAAVSKLTTLTTADLVRLLRVPRSVGSSSSSHSLLPAAPPQVPTQVQVQTQQAPAPLSNHTMPPPSSSKGAAVADLELDDLRVFLEKQTDLIVQGIQNLLSAMRDGTFGEPFILIVHQIAQVVDQLVLVSRNTLTKPALVSKRAVGERVLGDLAACNIKLRDLETSMRSTPKFRPQKHIVAASVRDVANFTKELVKLLE